MNRLYAFAISALALSLPYAAEASEAIQWQDSTVLRLKFDVTAGTEQLKSDYRIIVTPRVEDDKGNAIELGQVEFAGKRNRKYNDRAAALKKTQRNDVHKIGETVAVDTSVDVQPWMLASPLKLTLRRYMEGCCDVTDMPEQQLASTRYVKPVPPFVPQPEFVLPEISVAERIAMEEDVLHPIEEYEPYNPEVPLRKMKGSLYVHFPVGKSTLRYDYMQNGATLDKIIDIMNRIKADSTSEVVKVVIIGQASPEGPVALNNKLGINRAKALKAYINKRVQMPESIYETVNGGEAWADLRDVVAESDLPQRDRLLDIIDNNPDPNRRELLLRRLDGGRPYRHLKQEVFSSQRNSGYIRVYYEAKPDLGARAINEAVQLIREKKLDEAIRMLEKLDDGRKWNTLGVAYFMSGRKTLAIEAFSKAAEAGSPDAKRNLEELRKSGAL